MKKYNIGCLILHGFAGNRSEINSLVNTLSEYGYKTSAPLLAGHEASRRELARAKSADWIKSADAAYDELEDLCEKVVIIGFSMGGLIGVNLCQMHNASALVMVNTPVYYWNLKRIIKNLLCDFKFYIKKYFTASTGNPFSALVEFVSLLNKTKPLFSTITCTSLIIQTLDDDTVNPESANYIYSKIAGQKILKKYQTGGHVVFQNSTGDKICEELCNFLDEFVVSY
jgi:carboxylesterase